MVASSPSGRTGRCLCGAVSYAIAGPVRDILHCHCENCRRITGNFVAGTACATDVLTISGRDSLRWFDVGYARYGFCGECGSHLFWQGAEHRERTSVKVGSLDDASGLEVAAVWFADEAQPHVQLHEGVPHHPANGEY